MPLMSLHSNSNFGLVTLFCRWLHISALLNYGFFLSLRQNGVIDIKLPLKHFIASKFHISMRCQPWRRRQARRQTYFFHHQPVLSWLYYFSSLFLYFISLFFYGVHTHFFNLIQSTNLKLRQQI